MELRDALMLVGTAAAVLFGAAAFVRGGRAERRAAKAEERAEAAEGRADQTFALQGELRDVQWKVSHAEVSDKLRIRNVGSTDATEVRVQVRVPSQGTLREVSTGLVQPEGDIEVPLDEELGFVRHQFQSVNSQRVWGQQPPERVLIRVTWRSPMGQPDTFVAEPRLHVARGV